MIIQEIIDFRAKELRCEIKALANYEKVNPIRNANTEDCSDAYEQQLEIN